MRYDSLVISALLIGAALALTPQDANTILQIEAMRLRPEALDDFVRSPDAPTRARSARALGRLRTKEAHAALEALSKDPDPAVRAEAAWALGQTPDSGARLMTLIEGEQNVVVRTALLEALGRQGGPESIPVLLSALQRRPGLLRTSPDGEAAAISLGRLNMREVKGANAPEVTGALLDTLRRLDRELRRAAAFALGRSGVTTLPEDQLALLLERAEGDPDPVVQSFLLRCTGKLQLDPAARDALYTKTAADTDLGVRVATARAAGAGGWSGVTRLLSDPEVGVRLEAIAAVGRQKGLDHQGILLPLVQAGASLDAAEAARTRGDPAELLAAAALTALAAADAVPREGPYSLEVLLAPAQPTRLRAAAAGALKDRDRLVDLAVRDGEGSVRLEAASRVVELEPSTAQVVHLFDSFDDQVVAIAAGYVADHPKSGTEKAILGAMAAAEPDENDLLTYCLKALIALYSGAVPTVAKPAPEAARFASDLAGHPEASVSTAAMELARMVGVRPPPYNHRLYSVPLDEVSRVKGARVHTTRGDFLLTLMPDEAPVTVWNFASLADKGYFNGLMVHRVVPDFVVQDGDPRGDGTGGPGYSIPDELWPGHYREGVMGMALSGPDTGGSQWFVTLSPQPHLDGTYTIFGEVSQGMQVLRSMQAGDRILTVTIERSPAGSGSDPR